MANFLSDLTLLRLRYSTIPVRCTCGGMHDAHVAIRQTIHTQPRADGYYDDTEYVSDACDHCSQCTTLDVISVREVPQPDAIYSNYCAVLQSEASRHWYDWTFKSNPAYQHILEHVNQAQGEAYLRQLETFDNWQSMREIICDASALNDLIGRPQRFSSGLGLTCSPTNLRYAWQAAILLRHIASLKIKRANLIELGGGYGGLALFAQRLAHLFNVRIVSHTIVDVPEAGPIQATYARVLGLSDVRVVDGTIDSALVTAIESTSNAARIFVSAYAFSEISAGLRNRYEHYLTRYCPHGFLMWNRAGVYALAPGRMQVSDDPVLVENGTSLVLY